MSSEPEFCEEKKHHISLISGFSPNFSSAGKGPFMDGKAKRYTLFLGGGGWGSGGRDMDLDPLCFTRKNFETKEVKNLHRKKLENYCKPQEGA